jgi:ribonuclease R
VAPRAPARANPSSENATGGAHVAVIERRGKFLVAEPFFERGPRLVVSRDRRANVGDLVVVRAGAGRNGRRGGRATIARRLGRPDVARDVIEALMIDRGLRRSFDPALEHEARVASEDWRAERSAAGRRDLRSLPTFTIDPAGAKDFDDAISAQALEDGSWRVWVHIADVCAFVSPRSLIDREAYRRATSVYVPGAVEPMIPPELSNNVCSLVPGEDRLTVTAELVINRGEVTKSAFYRSVIRSAARLEYGQVDRIFDGTESAQSPWGEGLGAARAAAATLAERREAKGALAIDSAEPEFVFDREGNVTSMAAVSQTESHRLIEHLMIAANEQVARLLESRRVPALYRVHERPDGAAAERLIEQLASLEIPTPPVPRGHMSSQQAADLIGEASHLLERHLRSSGRSGRGLTALVLRSLKQAHYDHRNLGHAGLQLSSYCHFTSPIRRFPDIICHRALLSAVHGEQAAPEASWVTAAGPWCSAREREAMSIERDADDIARCFLLERLLFGKGDATFDGEVVGLAGVGAFVAFGSDGAFEGLLPVRKLRGEWWELGELGTMLLGAHSGRRIKLGDPVRVTVDRVEAPRGRVDLLPAWED